MAQKPIREATAKQLIATHCPFHGQGKLGNGTPAIRFAAIGPKTDLSLLPQQYPWLTENKLVTKVDELFGKRGKLGYVKIVDSLGEAIDWIEGLRGTEATIGERTGTLEHFLIEPFVEHENEYYLAFTCEREQDVILFSDKGGMEVEEQGDSIVRIPVELDADIVAAPIQQIPAPLRETVKGLFTLFRSLDFSFMEFNPLTEVNGAVSLLDTVVRVDTCAAHRQHSTWACPPKSDLSTETLTKAEGRRWGSPLIPEGFGTTVTPEEQAIRTLDAQTGSSLKFVLLNPHGRIWTMVAGGGASIIYADAIIAQAPASELANYGEWSGNPSTDEMEEYTSQILELVTRNDQEQALIIGGGIANFTDVAKTFAGVIRALRSHGAEVTPVRQLGFEEQAEPQLRRVRVYVRRAGPNDRKGLEALQKACDEMGIPCTTYGAELPMTEVVGMAINDLHLPTSYAH